MGVLHADMLQSLKRENLKVLVFSILGFGFYRLYISVFFVLSNVIPSPLSESTFIAFDYYSLFLVIFLFAFSAANKDSFFLSKWAMLIGSGCLSVGALTFLESSGAYSSWLFGFFAGLGVALLTLQWGCLLGQLNRQTAIFCVIIGFLFAAVINVGVGLFPEIYMLICALCGPCSALLLYFTARHNKDVFQEGAPNQRKQVVHERYVAKASIAFLIFSVASIFCSIALEFSVVGLPEMPPSILVLYRAFITFVVCLIVFLVAASRRMSVKAIYRLIPFFLIAGGLSVFLQQVFPLVTYACALGGRLGFQLVFWVFAPWIASCSKMSSLRAFGIEFSAYWFGYAVSLFAVRALWPERTLFGGGQLENSLVIASIVLLLVVYLFIFTEHDFRQATKTKTAFSLDADQGTEYTACENIVEIYKLSPREREVLMLIAKGRNSSYIQKSLFISAGTVSSHRQRIYKKIGIHNKQELLDLVEDMQNKLGRD